MPWRLLGFIILFGIFLVFIMFNLNNKCDISFGFRTFTDVPVFLTAFSSFIAGMLCSLPFALRARAKKKSKAAALEKTPASEKAKKRRGKKDEIPELPADTSFTDGGPYGVN